jgi:hypothetical protein
MAQCPSRFSLVLWKGGDLPEAEIQRIRAHAAVCSACKAQIKQLDANIEYYHPKQPAYFAQLTSELSATNAAPRPFSKWRVWAFALGGAAVTAALILALIDPRTRLALGPLQPGARFKGAVAMQAVAKRGDAQFFVESGAALRPNDAVRFVVTTGSAGFLSVFSIDSKRRIAPFYPDSDPFSDPTPMRIEGAGRHELPGSIVLDDATGAECIVAAFSQTPFDRGAVHERARRSAWVAQTRVPGPNESDADLTLSVLWISKPR